MKDIWNDTRGHWHTLPEDIIPPEHLPWTPTGRPLYAVTIPGHSTGVGRTPDEALQEAQAAPCAASSCAICGKEMHT